RLARQLVDGQTNSIQIKYDGEISEYDTNALKATVLGGFLEGISDDRVNLVNANIVAARRGLNVVERKEATCENYTSLITIEVAISTGIVTVATTVLRSETHIVRINDYWIDITPTEGYFLFCDHLDRPGLIGAVGKITGDANVDISSMNVGRLKPRGQALMILALDEPLPKERQEQILSIPGIYTAKLVKL
ncbi:MAG: phosphoglycerate dehydrogenase, partial [Chloroflexota bacterium]